MMLMLLGQGAWLRQSSCSWVTRESCVTQACVGVGACFCVRLCWRASTGSSLPHATRDSLLPREITEVGYPREGTRQTFCCETE
jgi:hypothetical protein